MDAPPALRSRSFIVIAAKEGVDQRSLECIVDLHRQHEGPALVPLGDDRFVLARAAMKRLFAEGRPEGRWETIRKAFGNNAREVRLENAEAVLADYRNRRLPVQTCPLAARTGWALDAIRTISPRSELIGELRHIRLAHLDTGYTEHEALGFGRLRNPTRFALDEGMNSLDAGDLPLEELSHAGNPGHGTETLSLIAGVGDNNFTGVAPGCTIIPYRISDSAAVDASSESSPLDRAVRHAAFDAACDVICIPLADPCPPPSALAEQIDAAYDAGIIVVAPAGDILTEVAYPGRYQRVVTVSGIAVGRRPWQAASRGRAVDICAPATAVLAATAGESGYGLVDGTSYAAALVAGAAVLWLGRRSGWTTKYPRDWRLVEAFRASLAASASVPVNWDERLWGAGILNISSLLSLPLPDPAGLASRPSAVLQRW